MWIIERLLLFAIAKASGAFFFLTEGLCHLAFSDFISQALGKCDRYSIMDSLTDTNEAKTSSSFGALLLRSFSFE